MHRSLAIRVDLAIRLARSRLTAPARICSVPLLEG